MRLPRRGAPLEGVNFTEIELEFCPAAVTAAALAKNVASGEGGSGRISLRSQNKEFLFIADHGRGI